MQQLIGYCIINQIPEGNTSRSKALEIIFCAELAGPIFHTTNYKVGSPSLRRPWGIPPRIAMQDSSGS
ncbi:hypothetical protein WN944_027419 [Citrus x changshan-huyou]|uniref:Uncharacterized protein n=1 Tax=Citrus x changshan-huyou TaxID=2935761 RepID=A0AAP0Q856_9ROSI